MGDQDVLKMQQEDWLFGCGYGSFLEQSRLSHFFQRFFRILFSRFSLALAGALLHTAAVAFLYAASYGMTARTYYRIVRFSSLFK